MRMVKVVTAVETYSMVLPCSGLILEERLASSAVQTPALMSSQGSINTVTNAWEQVLTLFWTD